MRDITAAADFAKAVIGFLAFRGPSKLTKTNHDVTAGLPFTPYARIAPAALLPMRRPMQDKLMW